ncbi:MAG: hypothetical protein SGCHY_003041 [Lobulomycetales sp.]
MERIIARLSEEQLLSSLQQISKEIFDRPQLPPALLSLHSPLLRCLLKNAFLPAPTPPLHLFLRLFVRAAPRSPSLSLYLESLSAYLAFFLPPMIKPNMRVANIYSDRHIIFPSDSSEDKNAVIAEFANWFVQTMLSSWSDEPNNLNKACCMQMLVSHVSKALADPDCDNTPLTADPVLSTPLHARLDYSLPLQSPFRAGPDNAASTPLGYPSSFYAYSSPPHAYSSPLHAYSSPLHGRAEYSTPLRGRPDYQVDSLRISASSSAEASPATLSEAIHVAYKLIQPALLHYLSTALSNPSASQDAYLLNIDTWMAWTDPCADGRAPSRAYVVDNFAFFKHVLAEFLSVPTCFHTLVARPDSTLPASARATATARCQLEAYTRVLAVYSDRAPLLRDVEAGITVGDDPPLFAPDAGAWRAHVSDVCAQVAGALEALGDGDASPARVAPPLPFSGAPGSEYVGYAVAALFSALRMVVDGDAAGDVYHARMRQKFRRVEDGILRVWPGVDAGGSSSLRVRAGGGDAGDGGFGVRDARDRIPRVGGRLVVMSYESEWVLTGIVVPLQACLLARFGVRVDLRWAADLRNLAFIGCVVAGLLVGVFLAGRPIKSRRVG